MNLSKWVDIQLQPLVKKLPSYLQDDNHFLKKINDINKNQTLPPNSLLVTWDVKSLYTNIPHKEGLEALRITLDRENITISKSQYHYRILRISSYLQSLQISWAKLLTDVRHSNGN